MTKIEWTDETWNPVTGCSPVSTGCQNCYAKRMATRLRGRAGYPRDDPFRVTMHPERLEQPVRWRIPRYVFCGSMGDLFHPDVPGDYIAAVFGIMAMTKHHTYQLLTKRPQGMMDWFDWLDRNAANAKKTMFPHDDLDWCRGHILNASYARTIGGPTIGVIQQWPLPNVWIGVTAEDQQRANERIPVLLQIPAAVRFVSCEPLLGPIDIDEACAARGVDCGWTPANEGSSIDWVIAGAETGPGARHMDWAWPRDLRDQCQDAGVPFFFKKDSRGCHTIDGVLHEEIPS